MGTVKRSGFFDIILLRTLWGLLGFYERFLGFLGAIKGSSLGEDRDSELTKLLEIDETLVNVLTLQRFISGILCYRFYFKSTSSRLVKEKFLCE